MAKESALFNRSVDELATDKAAYHHADIVFFSGTNFFDSIVQNNVHERVVTSQNSSDSSRSIEL
jgi:hypothetical protein